MIWRKGWNWHTFDDMVGGEIYVKKIPSMKVADLASAIAPDAMQKIVGIRPGEKLHEQMIGSEDAMFTYEYQDYFKILPQINNWDKDAGRIKGGTLVKEGFIYTSESNSDWMTKGELIKWVEKNKTKIGEI